MPPDIRQLIAAEQRSPRGDIMIVTGLILLVIGILARIGIVWTTGFVVLILGLIALLLGLTGHGIGGRRHYF